MILVILVAMSGMALANGDEPIELSKDESLQLIDLAFMVRAAQADLEETQKILDIVTRNFQRALGSVYQAKGVSIETHGLDLRNGLLVPAEVQEEELEEPTP